jgi:hypothetical protein
VWSFCDHTFVETSSRTLSIENPFDKICEKVFDKSNDRRDADRISVGYSVAVKTRRISGIPAGAFERKYFSAA